jgi:hypothetical protein
MAEQKHARGFEMNGQSPADNRNFLGSAEFCHEPAMKAVFS